MIGLLKKDIYTALKQNQVFVILMLAFALVPSGNFYAFAIFYASMLTWTAMSYDERCKWNVLALMMPYSKKDIVISKYILGYSSSIVIALLSCAAQTLYGHLGIIPAESADGIGFTIFLITCMALTILALVLPLLFKFGVEKGRLIFLLMLGAAAGLMYMTASGNINEDLNVLSMTGRLSGCVVVLLVLMAVTVGSVIVSIKVSWRH